RAVTCIVNGESSPAILYMFGIIRSRPCEAVNVVESAPACNAPWTAPSAPPSDCISAISGITPQRFVLPWLAHSSQTSAIGELGVIGKIAIASLKRKATEAAASLPSTVSLFVAGAMRSFQGLKLTPKAFANLSPRLERSDNPGLIHLNFLLNPERVSHPANPFRVKSCFLIRSQGCRF